MIENIQSVKVYIYEHMKSYQNRLFHTSVKVQKTLYERSLFCIYFYGHFLTKNGYKNLLTDDLYHDCY